jgi:hypothetical protein
MKGKPYSTTGTCGACGYGTVLEIGKTGTWTVLYSLLSEQTGTTDCTSVPVICFYSALDTAILAEQLAAQYDPWNGALPTIEHLNLVDVDIGFDVVNRRLRLRCACKLDF